MPELMTHGRKSKYFWPASAITPDDMALLYQARESAPVRIPISRLIARAIRQTYGAAMLPVDSITTPPAERRAA